jgi:hypothetical protein
MQLANELNRARFMAKGELIAYSADGEMESPPFFKGARSQDFTRPLQQWEIEQFGFKEFCRLATAFPLTPEYTGLGFGDSGGFVNGTSLI